MKPRTQFAAVLHQALVLPEILAERCVHSALETASCQACVDSCPRDAWVLDDASLGINTEVCDGCGLCAAACPQAAIAQPHEPAISDWHGRRLAFAACERAAVDSGPAVLPCLHALGMRDLLRLAGSGVTRLVIARADCDTCPRGRGETLPQRLAAINVMLADRGRASLELLDQDPAHWQRMCAALPVAGGPVVGRRAFLGRAIGAGLRQGLRLTGLHAADRAVLTPPGALIPRTRSTDIVPFAPTIDAEQCSGCDACVRLCPQAAIVLDHTAAQPAYRIVAEQCSGCGVCSDVCDSNAVSVACWQPVAAEAIPLWTGRCEACGVPFHRPQTGRANDPLCPICTRTQRHRNLYQVFGNQP
jgi:Pyruvate/2-oxoacid:ferredoxin oxidoreductase delta subunit